MLAIPTPIMMGVAGSTGVSSRASMSFERVDIKGCEMKGYFEIKPGARLRTDKNETAEITSVKVHIGPLSGKIETNIKYRFRGEEHETYGDQLLHWIDIGEVVPVPEKGP